MKIELVYARAARELEQASVVLPEGMTAKEALRAAGWVSRFPEIEAGELSLSVWGRRVSGHTALRDGDRLELCRPLRVDPKVARRERFVAQGARGSGLFASRRPGSKAGY